MFRKLLGWGQKPQQETPPPAPAPVEDYGPALDFHGLLEEIGKMEAGSTKTFKMIAVPGHSSQIDEIKKAVGVNGEFKFDWHRNTITVKRM